MRKSSSIKELADALSQAQAKFPPIPKTKLVKIDGKRTYTYFYAPLDEIRDAVKPALTEHGLSVSQGCRDGALHTLLMHRSGEWIESSDFMPPALDPKAYGSELSYRRRYALTSILGLATEDDDDGERAEDDHAIKHAPARAAQPGRLTDSDRADHLSAIDAAADLYALQEAFNRAYRAAHSLSDKSSLDILTRAKDSRKAVLAQAPGAR